MNRPEPLLIRADASERIGTGHVMRMIALAQAFQDRGGPATIVCATCQEHVSERIRQEKIDFEKLESDVPGSTADSNETIARARSLGSKWVVLDGYHFGVDYQRRLRKAGFRVMAMDDYGHCETWAADVVLNQNIYAPDLSYHSEVEGCRFLLGTRFALLRREFRMEAEHRYKLRENDASKKAHWPIRRLLVTLGGADPDNVTGQLLTALNSLSGFRLEIKAIAGGGNPHLANLHQLASTSSHSIEVLQNVLDMPSLYRWAEGVISAGGSTCWEWLFFRLPAAAVCLAENQRRVVAGLVKHQIALDLGWHENLQPSKVAPKLQVWLNTNREKSFPYANFNVDAMGAYRAVSFLDESDLWIRLAKAEDCRLYFEWANDPTVRANSLNPEVIAWESHVQWFNQKLNAKNCHLYVANNLEDVPVGQVRLERSQDGQWEIDISTDREWRSRGLGVRMLSLVLRVFWQTCPDTVFARVKVHNEASIRLFDTLGFKRVHSCRKDLIRFILTP